MRTRRFMRTLLVEESFAYGFTIAFWGSGLTLVNEYGLLETAGLLAYAAGTVTGFGLLALVAFGGAIDAVESRDPPTYVVLAGIHYLAGLAPIGLTRAILAAGFGRGVTLVLAGATVSIAYNVLATLEEVISEVVWAIENR